jgi:hypothetical protein
MDPSRDIVQAARDIQPYLSELLSIPDANTLREQLAASLAEESGTALPEKLWVLLTAMPTTEAWVRRYLESRESIAAILPQVRTYHPLSGREEAIASPRYRCPVASCQRTWYRPDVTAVIPHCPIHNVLMVRDSKAVPL